jgi:glycosyltransferase involved in cell wall biosynthesis
VKKILIVHNFYKEFGGEDSNIYEEIDFLKKKYEILFFYEENKKALNVYDLFSFILRSNIKTNKKFVDTINDFNPDTVYIHNTWFKINLGIFKILKKKKIKGILKIHNFRYKCGKHLTAKKHINPDARCHACGFEKPFLSFFNKYYSESLLKSIFLYFYSLKYIKILKHYPLTLVVLNEFHKRKLISQGINEDKIQVIYNPINFENNISVEKSLSLVYAGRISKEKGVEEVITSWMNSRVSHFTLYIIGEGNLKTTLEKKYNNKNLHFLGHLPNEQVLDYIRNAKAVVTATKLYEGQPRLLCEASSLGTVSIYPSFGGMDEFFPKLYKYSFKQFDYQDLERKLNLLNDKIVFEEATKNLKMNILQKLDKESIYSKFSKELS